MTALGRKLPSVVLNPPGPLHKGLNHPNPSLKKVEALSTTPRPFHKGPNHPNLSLKRGALFTNIKIVEDLVEDVVDEGFAEDAGFVLEVLLWHSIGQLEGAMPTKSRNTPMPQKETVKLVLWDKEPLMRLLAGKLTPVSLGICFFVCISLPLCILASMYQPGFIGNVSWSITIVFLFPFLVGLGFKYYEEVPKLFDHLLEDVVEDTPNDKKIGFYKWLNARFNNYAWTILILIFSLSLILFFFYQKQSSCVEGWMIGGDLLYFGPKDVTNRCGFTGVGLFAAILQFVIGYWFVNLAFRAAICYWGLYEFFNSKKKWNFQIRISPLHPDRCCGLGRIGDVAMLFNVIMFIIGIYVSLTVLDKILIQKSAPLDDITIPLYLGGYVLIAPVLFFLPLGSARRKMKKAKIEFLRPISERCEQLAKISSVDTSKESSEAVGAFFEMDKLRNQLEKEIPVWPFDFRSFLKFSGAIVFPVVPVIITLLTEFGRRLFLT